MNNAFLFQISNESVLLMNNFVSDKKIKIPTQESGCFVSDE
jgi:hypothetical protein